MKRIATTVLKGMGMGAADAVPGVSGGTIALIVGIYEELIETCKEFCEQWKDWISIVFSVVLLTGIWLWAGGHQEVYPPPTTLPCSNLSGSHPKPPPGSSRSPPLSASRSKAAEFIRTVQASSTLAPGQVC